MAALQAKVFSGAKTTAPRRVAVVARAEPTDRRQALAGLASVAALVASKPANAAYGDAANIFGKTTSTTGFIPYAGEGYALLLPSKWNPSKEQDFNNLVLRYEDNGDSVNCLVVLKSQASKPSIEAYGTPDAFLAELQNMGLFGKQAYTGSSKSEGGFADGRYAAASLLDQAVEEKKGKKYYTYDVLVRSADGDEGGRHQLIKAAVGSDGKLYILKVQIGDKRWFKGAKKDAVGAVDSFVVA